MKNFTQSPKEILTIITLIALFSIATINASYAQDQDGDVVTQVNDLDDDNDGVLDVVEGFGYNIYTSTCVGEGSIFIFKITFSDLNLNCQGTTFGDLVRKLSFY